MSRVLIFIVVVFAFCSPAGPTVRFDQDFVLARGEQATVAETGTTVRFVDVTGDSRCPADAICIQGGDAVVHVDVRAGDRAQSYELHTGNLQPVEHNGLTVRLVELMPYPFSSRAIRPEDYRATLRITR